MSYMSRLATELDIASQEKTTLGQAAKYLLNGWSVMPLLPNKKEPHFDLIKRSHLDATDNWEKVQFWFQIDPNANLGINCIMSGLVVIDIDYRNGGQVLECFNETYTVQTGDGLHLYYLADNLAGYKGSVADGIDVKHKGYVAAAPSIHPNGKIYTIVNPIEPVIMSDDLREMIAR